jgi:hypothetical protein
MLSFLQSASGDSPARYEFSQLMKYNRANATHLAVFLNRLGSGDLSVLSQARKIGPDFFYWWEYSGVGAFFAHDGIDIVIILVGVAPNDASFQQLLTIARARLETLSEKARARLETLSENFKDRVRNSSELFDPEHADWLLRERRLKAYLDSWAKQAGHERTLRTRCALVIFSLAGFQSVGGAVLLVCLGRGWLKLDAILLDILFTGLLGQIFGLFFVVVRYLFSEPLTYAVNMWGEELSQIVKETKAQRTNNSDRN